ncbi:MAG: ATP-binding protein [Candidatus Dadabacteria bacterium]|nr:ATP-binding protein [Candidatus Dadabacteria bacterium]
MNLLYMERALETMLIKAVSRFSSVLVSGPRQYGKTTPLQQLFESSCLYVFFELPDIRGGELHHVQMGRPVVTPCG